MAIYELHSARRKSTIALQTDENVPDAVTYVKYKDMYFERDLTPLADGKPNPYLWNEVEGPFQEGATCVDGKAMISKTWRGETWRRDSAQRLADGVRLGDIAPAEVVAQLDAMTNALAQAQKQIDALVAGSAAPAAPAPVEADAKVAALEALVARMQAGFKEAGIEYTDEPNAPPAEPVAAALPVVAPPVVIPPVAPVAAPPVAPVAAPVAAPPVAPVAETPAAPPTHPAPVAAGPVVAEVPVPPAAPTPVAPAVVAATPEVETPPAAAPVPAGAVPVMVAPPAQV